MEYARQIVARCEGWSRGDWRYLEYADAELEQLRAELETAGPVSTVDVPAIRVPEFVGRGYESPLEAAAAALSDPIYTRRPVSRREDSL